MYLTRISNYASHFNKCPDYNRFKPFLRWWSQTSKPPSKITLITLIHKYPFSCWDIMYSTSIIWINENPSQVITSGCLPRCGYEWVVVCKRCQSPCDGPELCHHWFWCWFWFWWTKWTTGSACCTIVSLGKQAANRPRPSLCPVVSG